MRNTWVYVVMTKATCALIISQYNIIVGACPFLKWSLGEHFQDVKHWLKQRGLLKEWQEMGKIKIKKGAILNEKVLSNK